MCIVDDLIVIYINIVVSDKIYESVCVGDMYDMQEEERDVNCSEMVRARVCDLS